jgi:RNA polymerase sigma factor (sigma-70 family)
MNAEPLAIVESDEQLVGASLGGDRAAFARLVERHQAAVCAVTHAAAGQLGLGQDLAQETFLEAWRSLGSLRDAGQLRAWLCGIARNVAHNAIRRRGASADPDAGDTLISDEPTPEDGAIIREETRTVGRALADIPEGLRAALILFYWEDQSIRRVGEALGLSEDAVRQRLSRGRKLLRTEIEGIRRLRPGKTFTAAVLAALPLGTREAAAACAGVIGKSTAAKVAAGLGAAGAGGLAGALGGVCGAFIGARASIVNTRSPRERRFMVKMVWVAVALSAGMLALQAGVAMLFPALFRSIAWHVAVAAIEIAAISWLVVRGNRRQRQIQQEDRTATPEPPPSGAFAAGFTVLCLAYVAAALVAQILIEQRSPEFAGSAYGQLTFAALYGVGLLQLVLWAGRRGAGGPETPPEWSRGAIHQSLGGGVFGSLCWMLPMCVIAGDYLTALVVVAAGVVAFRMGTAAVLRSPDRYYPIASRVLAALSAVTLVVVNLRWEAWLVAYRKSALYQAGADLPLWAMNLLIVAVTAWTTILLARRGRGG